MIGFGISRGLWTIAGQSGKGILFGATLAFPARTLALSGHPKPPTTLLRSAQSRVFSSRSLCKAPTRTPFPSFPTVP
jgi:hypothetical protein